MERPPTREPGGPSRPAGGSVRLAAAGAVLPLLALAALTTADPDLWGHVRFGLDLLRDFRLTPDDPYSFTQDRPWINHEWLSELQMGAAWLVAGSAGLAVLKGVLVAVSLAVVWHALRPLAFPARVSAFAVACVGVSPILQTLRPQLWTFLCFAVLVRLLSAGPWRQRLWVPPLCAVWANLHGGWLVGLAVLSTWAGVRMTRGTRHPWRWLGLVVASGLATLSTPYGVGLWRFLWETVSWARPAIEEWQPLWRLAPATGVIWLATFAAVVWGARERFANRGPVLAVLAVLALASLLVARVTPLFVVAAVILLAPGLAARWPADAATPMPASRHDRLVAALILAVGLALALGVGRRAVTCVTVQGGLMPDPAALPVLDGAPPGRLVTFFNWGEYAIWHVGPALKVSMDGRRETVYSDRRLAEHDAILQGTDDGLRVLASWNPAYVWLPSSSDRVRTWLVEHGYRVVAETAWSFVAARRDIPPLAAQPADVDAPRCFPR